MNGYKKMYILFIIICIKIKKTVSKGDKFSQFQIIINLIEIVQNNTVKLV